jgi:uncharacterized membrane protein
VQILIIGLRLIHILAGIFWVGTTLFFAFFLAPALGSAGPAAGPVMGGLQRRGMMTALPVSALLTLGSGVWLYQLGSGGSIAAFMRSPTGATFAGAGTLALLAFVLGMAVARPAALAAVRMNQELATITDEAERAPRQDQLGALQRKNAVVSRVVAVMLIAAAAGMAVARYL